MPPLTVVEDIGVLDNLAACLFRRFVMTVMHELVLEYVPAVLARHVIAAVVAARR